MGIRCFFLEPTDRVRLSLRRYTAPGCYGRGTLGYHNASVVIGDAPVVWHPKGDGRTYLDVRPEVIAEDDPRWPEKCAFCDHHFVGHPFNPQLNQSLYYRRQDMGEEMVLEDAPAGAMWYADWYSAIWKGPDGHSLVCRVPGGNMVKHDWIIDSRANNCDRPEDTVHRCWVRHGTPPKVTVDKHGNTCGAGAGSILVPGWHGYLRAGELVT